MIINGFFIWDKQSKINNNSAETVMNSDKNFRNLTTVFLTYNNRPYQHGFIEDLRDILNMQNATNEEVAQAYFNKVVKEQQEQEDNKISTEDKISILEDENKSLKESQITQDDEILQNMLATTEIFEMVLVISTPMALDIENKNIGGNCMVEVYVTLILKGAKTIDQVPQVIRQKVEEQLELLTK